LKVFRGVGPHRIEASTRLVGMVDAEVEVVPPRIVCLLALFTEIEVGLREALEPRPANR